MDHAVFLEDIHPSQAMQMQSSPIASFKKRGSSSREKTEPWPYKDFEEICKGSIEYTDQTSDQTSFVLVTEKNGKVTRSSATCDGAGIQCNYRQGIVYMLVQEDLHSIAMVLSSGLETIPCVRYFCR